MDLPTESNHVSTNTGTSIDRAHSPFAANALDEAFSSQFGDGEHDDVVWDDASEYECLHEDRGGVNKGEETHGQENVVSEDDQHSISAFPIGGAPSRSGTDPPISNSTTTTAMNTSSSSSPRASSLLRAEGITQEDDARLAELLHHCLRSNPRGSATEGACDFDEGVIYDEMHEDDVEYEDDYEDDQEDEEPEEGEIQQSIARPQWQLPAQHRPTPLPLPSSSSSSSPLPSSSSDASYRQPVQKQQSQFSMDEFMRGAIANAGSKKRSSLQPAMSPSQVTQMTNRFRLHEERRARRLAAKRRDAETQQRLGFSYAPSINGNSRRLTRHVPTFLERQHSFLTRKQQHAQHEVAKQQQVHDRALELHARVRTPCICRCGGAVSNADAEGSSNHATTPANPPRFDAGGLRSPAASPTKSTASGMAKEGAMSPGSGHSQACQRFMAMCEKMNASFAIQRKKERMRRSVDDMLAFQREKQQRQQERAAQALARETQEETFAPRINPQSERICAALVESGRLDAEIIRRVLRPRKAVPLPPRLTFQPTISCKSKRLVLQRQKRSAYTGQGLAHSALNSGYQLARDADVGSRSPDVFTRLQSSGVWPASTAPDAGRPAAKGLTTSVPTGNGKAASSEVRPACDPASEVWTDVKFDAAKHAFILHGFELEQVFKLDRRKASSHD